nr:hypothetical protein [Tanacetum cinerariifolium]
PSYLLLPCSGLEVFRLLADITPLQDQANLRKFDVMLICFNVLVGFPKLMFVKNKREKYKIGTKPDKNGKRGEARRSQEQSQSRKQEKLKKAQKEGPKMQTPSKLIKRKKEQGLEMQFPQILIKRQLETELMLEEKFRDLCEEVCNFVKEIEDVVKEVERLS